MSKRLTKAQFQYIEDELRHYHETKKELEELRSNVITGSIYREYRDDNIGGSSGGGISNPVERQATILEMDKQINRMGKVVSAIESVICKISECDKTMIQLRYWSNYKHKWEYIATQSFMERSTAIRHRDVIIKEIAEQLGFRK
ncbi:DUF722 domain-containing protein [Paenilisteria rocourtiae]|uniref:RinA family phage transcriptional activator n=1 Tax=Listeria rocourtiae TaxID=647910 RepID=A0A4R6ZHJ5_9LIST|nr:DUF722 domain-containing protein [Listeria rocourtiae]EUJ46681.1 gp63 protein [Listeria rocourtiae FSL F6-920]TDR51720.1 RinA family phage transcriptional activator [Listeria rocourtiae]